MSDFVIECVGSGLIMVVVVALAGFGFYAGYRYPPSERLRRDAANLLPAFFTTAGFFACLAVSSLSQGRLIYGTAFITYAVYMVYCSVHIMRRDRIQFGLQRLLLLMLLVAGLSLPFRWFGMAFLPFLQWLFIGASGILIIYVFIKSRNSEPPNAAPSPPPET